MFFIRTVFKFVKRECHDPKSWYSFLLFLHKNTKFLPKIANHLLINVNKIV